MLPALLLAAACAGWHGVVAGHYRGEVESQGTKSVDTWIEETPAGLAGSYVLHERSRDVVGTLEALGEEGCNVGLFRWTDIYGAGVARLRFDPARRCFEGSWGRERVNPQLVWRSCGRSRVTS